MNHGHGQPPRTFGDLRAMLHDRRYDEWHRFHLTKIEGMHLDDVREYVASHVGNVIEGMIASGVTAHKVMLPNSTCNYQRVLQDSHRSPWLYDPLYPFLKMGIGTSKDVFTLNASGLTFDPDVFNGVMLRNEVRLEQHQDLILPVLRQLLQVIATPDTHRLLDCEYWMNGTHVKEMLGRIINGRVIANGALRGATALECIEAPYVTAALQRVACMIGLRELGWPIVHIDQAPPELAVLCFSQHGTLKQIVAFADDADSRPYRTMRVRSHQDLVMTRSYCLDVFNGDLNVANGRDDAKHTIDMIDDYLGYEAEYSDLYTRSNWSRVAHDASKVAGCWQTVAWIGDQGITSMLEDRANKQLDMPSTANHSDNGNYRVNINGQTITYTVIDDVEALP